MLANVVYSLVGLILEDAVPSTAYLPDADRARAKVRTEPGLAVHTHRQRRFRHCCSLGMAEGCPCPQS